MAGSMRLVKSPDTWELRVYLGRDAKGKVKHRHVRFRGSKKEAERELSRLVLLQFDNPQPVPNERSIWNSQTTINTTIEAWKSNGWNDLSPTTTRRYESIWKVHIKDSIGKERISSLSTYEVERYLRNLKEMGLAEASVRQTRAILKRACRLAQKWSGGVLPNPFLDSEMPSYAVSNKTQVRAPAIYEVRKLLGSLDGFDIRFATFIRVVLATGMRRGEACALRWSDIDFDNGTLLVDESVVAANDSVAIKGPKTLAGIRRLAIDECSIDQLKRLKEVQMELAVFTETELLESGFVFSFAPGGLTPPYPDTFSHHFATLRERAGVLGDIHLHSLRHFQATLLDPIISERQKQARLGWSNSMMARHYTDVISTEDYRAARYVASVLDETEQGS